MGLDSFIGVELGYLIQQHTNLNASLQEIQEFTFEDLKGLSEKSNGVSDNSQDPDLLSIVNFKFPPTLIHKDPLINMNEGAPGEPVFVVSIGDTDVLKFQIVAKMLNRPFYVLVWTKDVPSTCMESLASYYLNLIERTTKGPFHIVGHSLGGSVALEMALLAEKLHTALKTISLLEGSEDIRSCLSKEDLENKASEADALCKFVEQFVSDEFPRLKKEKEGILFL
ncbi:fatty acid synthase [Nephila pilipes]|uniref:oleoyl-[acyl-carrier-protein] hydrolase n=1 Tax=Nephila pilipes TaxID=299642 RepID=A0A8X6PC85_NEPPI|nr:fatty acid synthase [Nephila pilipes]